MYLLDTNIVSEPMRLTSNSHVSCLLDIRKKQCTISTITLYELLYGIYKMPNGKRKKDYRDYLNGYILRNYSMLPYDHHVATIHASVDALLTNIGKKPPFRDSMIAATALAHDLTLVTRNVKDFSSIAEIAPLKIENWFIS